MISFWQDIRFGIRMLLKNPGITAHRRIHARPGDRRQHRNLQRRECGAAKTASVSATRIGSSRCGPECRSMSRWRTTPANFFDWKKQNTVFEDIAAFGSSGPMTLTGDGEPEQLLGTRVSAGYFSVVGVEPIVGPLFRQMTNTSPVKGR